MKLHILSLALSVSLLSGCVVNLVEPPTTPQSPAPNTTASTITNGVMIAGMVKAHDGVISTGGGNVIATGGGNVISTGGGNVISTGGGNLAGRQVLAVAENPLGNTEVFVADAAGNKIPGIPSVFTDAQGRFELKGVPADRTFVIVAKAKTAGGKDAQLQTLAKTTDVGTTADVDVNTTLVTAGVVEQSGAKLGNFNPATFATAVQATQKNLTTADVPDLSDRAAVTAQVKKLMNEVAELKTAIDDIRKELAEIKQELKELKGEVEKLKAKLAANPNAPTAAPGTGAPSGDPCTQLFAAIDADANQAIGLNEWLTAWRGTGSSDYEIGFMFGYYDADYSDSLTPSEMERFCYDLNAGAGQTAGEDETDDMDGGAAPGSDDEDELGDDGDEEEDEFDW